MGKMKVLFLHPNFPGQFKNIVKAASEAKHDVVFLCQTHYGREIKGIKKLTLKGKLGNLHLDQLKASGVKRNHLLSNQYRKAFEQLKENNWDPDIIISHSGWGCGLFAKEIWPKSKLISYLEWWFNPESSFFSYDESNKELNISRNSIKKQWERNQTVALELACSDTIVCPTKWQRSQLPKTFQSNCTVIFDGIDTSIFKQKKKDGNKTGKILTYGTRGMDPMRAFPQFIKALPDLLNIQKDLVVEIAGVDDTFYGPKPKNKKGITTWGIWAKEFLKAKNVESRVKWRGRLEPKKYVNWLQNSDCHVYLTHPFVVS